MSGVIRKTKLFMDTVVDIQVVIRETDADAEAAVDRAFQAFRMVEHACSRFSPDSELMKACRHIGVPVQISRLLFEPLRFALELAEWTNGAFDPAVGKAMEDHGFNRHYLTGQIVRSPAPDQASHKDIVLGEQERTLILRKPLVIDLGAVAKGFAVDLAAQELKRFEGFIINAGGDLYAGGTDVRGSKWAIGIQHPGHKDRIIETIEIADEAICTSGSYERKSAVTAGIHHLIDPQTNRSPGEWISCTVLAPYAMMADAFSTAAFLLGADRGIALLEQFDLKGILITPGYQIYRTGGM